MVADAGQDRPGLAGVGAVFQEAGGGDRRCGSRRQPRPGLGRDRGHRFVGDSGRLCDHGDLRRRLHTPQQVARTRQIDEARLGQQRGEALAHRGCEAIGRMVGADRSACETAPADLLRHHLMRLGRIGKADDVGKPAGVATGAGIEPAQHEPGLAFPRQEGGAIHRFRDGVAGQPGQEFGMIDQQQLGARLRHRGTGLGDPADKLFAREERAHATSQMSRMVSM